MTELAERGLNTREAAIFLGVGKSSLEKWRLDGSGPSYRKLHGRVVYIEADLREYRDRFKRLSTSEQPQPEITA